ncbi:hypothetical protein Q4F19_18030 [Sphingomonas sp. BIUV-7]|uniref:F5/8 type C domain-containing protein n=1 Tax=Sphingomonas natans TaxID=3063330 RepID=A0ABT8YD84_9SPHN|nr:hypothetical protein [Sphingomonas sp. BIUV-7]MDO6416290.1 hypothetical protein [Sphingomonas sp. BIUV-7]
MGHAAPPPIRGLSIDFPARAQPQSLVRGPTPASPTFRISRTGYLPSSAIAGSNTAEAGKTIDDDELTRWASDGKAENGWIEYRFDYPVTLSDVDLKLVGWRSRGYPLSVTLDGRTVWTGTTDRRLGYARLSFPPATGSLMRITLTAPTEDRDAFGKVVELNNQRAAADTGAEEVPPGWRMGIVEADFAGPAGGR